MKKGILTSLGLAAVLTLGLASVNEYREVKEVDAAEETVTISFASTAQRTSFSAEKQVWENKGVVLINNKTSSSNDVANYSNPARFYKNSELIVEASGNISKIVFTCSGGADYYLSDVTNGVSNGAVTTVTLDGTSNSYTIPSLANQVRLASVEITYSPNPFIEFKNFISDYYHEGVYTKQTDIYLKENVTADLKTYFHGGSVPTLSRTTYYVGDALWMENGTNYSYYGTDDAGNMTSGRVSNVGDTVDSIAVKGKTMEEYYVTLDDFIKGTHNSVHSNNQKLDLTAGWTKDENNVFSSNNADVLDAFRLFTAPLWIGKDSNNENYLSFTNATVEEKDGKLIMKLYVSTTEYSAAENEGKITKSDGLFSQAIISYKHTGGTATCKELAQCVDCGKTYGEFADHVWALELSNLGDKHAYKCTNNGCTATTTPEEHDYTNGTCECGSTEATSEPVPESLSIKANTGELSSDNNSISWYAGNFEVTNKKGSTPIRTSDSNHYRVYAGSTTTISGKAGAKIKNIVITCTSDAYATVCCGSVEIKEGVSAAVDGTKVTITVSGTAIDSITINATGQWRMSEVVVTYIK